MPILAAFLGAIFASIVSFLAKWLSKRVAVILVAVSALVALTSAFILSIDALYSLIIVVFPDSLNAGLSWVIPPNAKPCVAATLTAYSLRWVYDWNSKIIQLKLF